MYSFESVYQALFSPLDRSYCNIFYAISALYFIAMIYSIFFFIPLIKDVKKNGTLIFNSVLLLFSLGINYLYNRVLFGMCGK
jgi:hypothetical protein